MVSFSALFFSFSFSYFFFHCSAVSSRLTDALFLMVFALRGGVLRCQTPPPPPPTPRPAAPPPQRELQEGVPGAQRLRLWGLGSWGGGGGRERRKGAMGCGVRLG